MRKKILIGLGAFIVVVAVGFWGAYIARHEITRRAEHLPPFTDRAGESNSVMVSMRDGTQLYTTIDLPGGAGPFPTILLRSPYAKYNGILRDTLCGRFVRYGYGCVFQDTRGQGRSEGDWNPFNGEDKDGHDTLQWLIAQPFQNGNIALVGPSYLAGVQWAAASAGLPPEVKTIVPAVYATDLSEVLFQDGMFRHETFSAWATMMRGRNSDSPEAGKDYEKILHHLPHSEVDRQILQEDMPWYREMIHAEDPSAAYWQRPDLQALQSMPQKTTIPVLMIGGWYDVFLGGQLSDWRNLASQSQSLYVIGPWTHIGTTGSAFKLADSGGGIFQWQIMLPWLEHHLKGVQVGLEPGVRSYTVRQNRWHQAPDWPPQSLRQKFYLDLADTAKTCQGGVLVDYEPQEAGRTTYEYDPLNPVPTRGGAGMLAFALPGVKGAPPGLQWQDGLCEREDVLTFVGPSLEEPMRIAGDIKVRLRVASSAPDTAFTAKLVEVTPEGRTVNIRDSITSLKYRSGARQAQLYQPGTQVDIDIRFWPIDYELPAGSRLRIDISSSDFPKYHFHRNTAEPWADATQTQIATQTVETGPASWVELDIAQKNPS
ncbi:MAG: CocE/NonD family hydrolase [Alphaproteobacteria bacterium]|nr:MAG: CocE/NonD family hydrolase [Alphaproteobacteria bacterium]